MIILNSGTSQLKLELPNFKLSGFETLVMKLVLFV